MCQANQQSGSKATLVGLLQRSSYLSFFSSFLHLKDGEIYFLDLSLMRVQITARFNKFWLGLEATGFITDLATHIHLLTEHRVERH